MTTTATTVNDKITGYIRTYVGYGVGAALAWVLLHSGLDLHGPVQDALLVLVIALVTNGYYWLIRLLEVRFPILGVLLGLPKAPEYTAVDNLWASFVRTAIPTVVSAFVVGVLAVWVTLDPDQSVTVITVVSAVVSSAYYTVARAIVTRWPAARWLLGSAEAPAYQPSADTTDDGLDGEQPDSILEPSER